MKMLICPIFPCTKLIVYRSNKFHKVNNIIDYFCFDDTDENTKFDGDHGREWMSWSFFSLLLLTPVMIMITTARRTIPSSILHSVGSVISVILIPVVLWQTDQMRKDFFPLFFPLLLFFFHMDNKNNIFSFLSLPKNTKFFVWVCFCSFSSLWFLITTSLHHSW